ncbi:MAG: YfhO family protein [Candidatus Thermoplasmatota archaeon]|nr:YfhO family protein [Candidatus Thermoplasmatota archaeon]
MGDTGSSADLLEMMDRKNRLRRFLNSDPFFILLIFITVTIFFWRILLEPDHMIYSPHSDTIDQFYPWRLVADRSMRDGELPFWNPFNFGGEPLLANMQLGFFYPINLVLFMVFPVHSAFGLSFMLHLFIAGLSVYLVARRVGLDRNASFISSMVFIFSGYFMGHVYSGHYGQVCSASWIPMIYLTFDHALKRNSLKWGVITGLLVGNQFLAGHIQIVLFSAIMLIISYIYHIRWHRRSMRKLKNLMRTLPGPLTGAMIAIFTSSLQIVPSYILTQGSTRSGGMSYLWVTDYSLPPWNLITLLAPRLFGTPLEDNCWSLWNYWELSIYVGIPTLVLLLFSFRYRKERYFRFFLGLGIFSLIMAMGRFTPLYWVFWRLVPGFDILRAPSRFVLLSLFSCSILAGFGFRHLRSRLKYSDLRRILKIERSLLIASASILVVVFLMLILEVPIADLAEEVIMKVFGEGDNASEYTSLIGSAFDTAVIDILVFILLLTLTTGVLIWRSKRKEMPRYFGTVLTLFIFINLAIYHMPFIDSKDQDEIYEIQPFISFLQENCDGYRVHDPDDIIGDNYQIIYGIETVDGYNPLRLRYYSELVSSIRELEGSADHPVLDLLGVRYVVSRDKLSDTGFKLVFNQTGEDPVLIYENPNACPRAFIVSNFTVADDETILKMMARDGFDPLDGVLINCNPMVRGQKGTPSVIDIEPRIIQRTNNRIDIEARLQETGFLVISQSYYGSWDVIVDGDRDNVDRVYHGLTGVYLNEGDHKVSLIYDRYP